MAVKGGRNLDRVLKKAKQENPVKKLKVGFFATSRYRDKDGTPVAFVAAVNEFGTEDGRIPERPFFRNAIRVVKDKGFQVLKNRKPGEIGVDKRTADIMGAEMQNHIQLSIRNLRQPANAPATVERKGSSNPLIDTARMYNEVTWEIED